MFLMIEYWPFDLMGTKKARRFDYTTADGSLAPIASVFWYDAQQNALIYSDFDEHNNWKDDWVLTYKPGFGVAEIADYYPQTGCIAQIFGKKKTLAFSTPIMWGDKLDIGGACANTPVVDPLKSCPPQFGSCFQSVQLEAHLESFGTKNGVIFNDVIVLTYLQIWGTKCTGARYWLAKGCGPVAVQWLGVVPEQVKYLGVDNAKVNLITTARMDAVVTNNG